MDGFPILGRPDYKGSTRFLDLYNLLDDMQAKGRFIGRIRYKLGRIKNVNWNKIKQHYGNSIINKNDSLRQWCIDNARNKKEVLLSSKLYLKNLMMISQNTFRRTS